MKRIEEPAIAKQARHDAVVEFAASQVRELQESAQDFLVSYGALGGLNVFDADDENASMVFAGAILFASNVFTNRLVLGRGYANKEDKSKILAALHEILEILEK